MIDGLYELACTIPLYYDFNLFFWLHLPCTFPTFPSNHLTRGWGNLVSIATRYGLEGPGIESQWGRDFPHPSRPTLGSTQPPIQRVACLSRG